MIHWTQFAVAWLLGGLLLFVGNVLLLRAERFADGSRPFDASWPETLQRAGIPVVVGQAAVLWGALLALGLFLADRAGATPFYLMTPEGAPVRRLLRGIALGAGWGIAAGVLFEGLRNILFAGDVDTWNEDCRFSRWKAFVGAALTAGIYEELLFRMILLSGLAWGLGWFWPGPDGGPGTGAFWAANGLASVVMAVTHLPLAGEAVPRTTANRIKVFLLISAVSLLLGHVYWTYGFDVAALCHGVALLFSWAATAAVAGRRPMTGIRAG